MCPDIPRSRFSGLLATGTLCLVIACSGTGSGSGTSSPAPSTTYYGSQINADDLANIVVGWNTAVDSANRTTSYRLRSAHSGSLSSIRPFFIWSSVKAGYQSGTGGQIQIQIQADDGTSNHFPSGTALASLVYYPPVTSSSTYDHYPLLSFPNPADLASGQLFHVVFTNIDPQPKVNWVSLDCLWMYRGFASDQPTVSNTDMAVLERNEAGAWVRRVRGTGTSITPCIELDFADGTAQGQGYIQGYGAPDGSFVNPKPISGAQQVREIFTVSGSDRMVSSVTMRVNRTSGTSPLTATVEKSDGTLVGQGTVLVAQGGLPTANFNGSSWAKVTFPVPLQLKAGVAYHLVLSSPADTMHTAHVLQKGDDYGFKRSTYFADGHAEFNSGSGWKGWDLWGLPNLLNTDLQFYFEVSS